MSRIAKFFVEPNDFKGDNMLPKRLFVQATAMAMKIANKYKGETKGQTGLRAIPIEIGRSIGEHLDRLAREQHVRINDSKKEDFLKCMGKLNVIVPHPLGGWMAPPTPDDPIAPSR